MRHKQKAATKVHILPITSKDPSSLYQNNIVNSEQTLNYPISMMKLKSLV